MALCIEGSLFSFCFPIKNKSVLKFCWLLISGGEGWQKSVLPTHSWPRDVQGCEAEPPMLRICSLGLPPSLCFPHIPWVLLCCPSPVHRAGSYHPNSQPKPQISVSPGLITLPVLLVIHPRAAQPCLCLPRCTGASELPKQSLFHENCFIQHLRRAAAAGRGQVYTDACVSGLASRCLLALHRPPSH